MVSSWSAPITQKILQNDSQFFSEMLFWVIKWFSPNIGPSGLNFSFKSEPAFTVCMYQGKEAE